MKFVETVLDLLHVAPGQHTAIITPETNVRITHDCLRGQVLAMADALAAAGLRREDRISIALPNGLAAIVSFLAAAVVGTAAPLNLAYRREELHFFLQDTGARALICSAEDGAEARAAAAELGIRVFTVETTSEGTVQLACTGSPVTGSAQLPTRDDVALILHTSGSTGRSKRVPLHHRNLAVSARNIVHTYSLTPDDVSLCVMPLFHVHGIVASLLSTLLAGGTVVVPRTFNALAFWRLVREHRVTWYSSVPTVHQLVLARCDGVERPAGTESLRFIRSASSPLPPELMRRMQDLFEVPVVEAYGMTEAAHQVASNPLPPLPRKPGSVGLPTAKVSTIDEQGEHTRIGQRGEVVIRGENVFQGYENNPEANATAFIGGWFRTGDQGFIDSGGYLHLTGRSKELINRAGEKIAPRYIDEVLLSHPAVAEAVTFGMAHATLGEEVAAAVVLRTPEKEAALLKFCRERLAPFEVPKKLYIVETIPRTATGKIQRNVVAAAFSDKRAA